LTSQVEIYVPVRMYLVFMVYQPALALIGVFLNALWSFFSDVRADSDFDGFSLKLATTGLSPKY